MSLLTLAEAVDQCNADSDYPTAKLQAYIDAAEAKASAYLNRTLFADATSLATAQDAVPGTLATAGQAYATANDAADATTDVNQAQAMRDVAQARWDTALADAARTVQGMVVNQAIMQSIRLTVGHFFANREDVLTGVRAAAVELPNAATALLRPYRRVVTP